MMRQSTVPLLIIEIQSTPGNSQSVDVGWLRECLARAVAHIKRPSTRVAISLVNDASMIELHQRHMGLRTTTDVLTFPSSVEGDPIDVDIALCVDEAARRASQFGHTIERELLLYALHGLLHCCGFDDHDEAGYRSMHAEEDRILNAIGVGPTFDPQREAASGDEKDMK